MADPAGLVDLGITLGRAGVPFDEESEQAVAAWLRTALPDEVVDRAVEQLIRAGFEVTGRSRFTLSLRAPQRLVEEFFSTKLSKVLDVTPGDTPGTFRLQVAENMRLGIPDGLKDVIGVVEIQPVGRVSAIKAKPPKVEGVHYLDLDVLPALLKVPGVHGAGVTGDGVRLTMIDTGFEHDHPFFAAHDVHSKVLLAGGARSSGTDENGHGTGCSALVFAIAPKVEFTGIKIGDPQRGGDASASLLAGLQRALGFDPANPRQRVSGAKMPQVISLSVTCGEVPGTPLWTSLPQKLNPMEACIREAVLAEGVTVVAAAGNQGERGFPAQMKLVIAVGGVFSPKQGPLRASNFASAFTSKVYDDRKVPDLCGLCGEGDDADYLMLPVPSGSTHDAERGAFDGTTKLDGWARFSGTSAATPQVAAICALMLEKDPELTPKRLKSLLRETAKDVAKGKAATMAEGTAAAAAADADLATGAGLVDAFAALSKL